MRAKVKATQSKSVRTPVSVYVVHHPDSEAAKELATALYKWFRLGYLSGDATGAGLPVYYRRSLRNGALTPAIDWDAAALNVVLLLVDEKLVLDPDWRSAAIDLANEVDAGRAEGRHILLPVALHDSFYRVGPIYDRFNPIRLLDMPKEQMEATLRRAATEAVAREMRHAAGNPPLNVFVSHAKADGRIIAEQIRDNVRRFGQITVWYDANDLPYGSPWDSPMTKAAKEDTAAMISILSDTYPSRPWCRKEIQLARTPQRHDGRIWKVQPVVSVHDPGQQWVTGVGPLGGVPRIGWDRSSETASTERIVDRLVLEMLLGQVHRRVAQDLDRSLAGKSGFCFITWVPDVWSLLALRDELGPSRETVKTIVYPGHGLTLAEVGELGPALRSFQPRTELASYEDVMP